MCATVGWVLLPVWERHLPQHLLEQLPSWPRKMALPAEGSDPQISALKTQLEQARQDIDKNRYRLAILEQKKQHLLHKVRCLPNLKTASAIRVP